MSTDETVGDARSWRLLEAIGIGAVGVTLFAVLVINLAVIPPVLIFAVLYLALGVAVWRWIDRPRVALAAAVLALLGLIGNLPFLAGDLSHIDSWGSFAPSVVGVAFGLSGIAAGVISFFAPAMQGSRQLMAAAAALSVVLVIASVGLSVTAESDEAKSGDVTVLAEDVEFPETLTAAAGQIGFHVVNEDLVHHTFVIEGEDVKLEVPASKSRRIEANLPAGEYRFICDVPGHERMEGTLTVR